MKPFKRWKYEEVELTFGTERVRSMPTLTEWLKADETADDFETKTLNIYYDQLVRKIDAWNEDELKFFFLSHIITLVDFTKPKVYSSFSQRTIATIRKDVNKNDVNLRGRVEFLVATGEQIPRQPFFFIHEYKPLNKSTPSDPLGQLLITMVATQTLNKVERPLYGTYIRGSSWQFVVLENNQYAVSEPYEAVKHIELFKIFSILKRCKSYIEELVK
ncbi:MAG: hypothetical protein U5L45_18145 [Saprospiraceae bacterium]|nr:hypothetical protein [Saprospiraceae bacterium]